MPVDLTAIRALLASVAGFTEGPWTPYKWSLGSAELVASKIAQVARNSGGSDLHAAIKQIGDAEWIYPAFTGNGPTSGPNAALIAAAPDLHRELTEAVGEIEIRDRQQAGTQAMLDRIWRTLNDAGVRDDVDERYMQQVSEHCYEPAGEYRQADPEERVGFLAAEVVRLRAHNARMVAELLLLADACDKARSAYGSRWGENGGAEDVACALPGDSWAETGAAIRDLANDLPPIHDSDAMTAWEASRRLAAGEVDDG